MIQSLLSSAGTLTLFKCGGLSVKAKLLVLFLWGHELRVIPALSSDVYWALFTRYNMQICKKELLHYDAYIHLSIAG